ncbi:MAG: hypothetical protein NTY59_09630, partial [Alphaproteobacteria bacterium]|nr:hypothetical protein [Alphaproteobacteria bacterium]
PALAAQNINLPQLRNDLFCRVSLPRHRRPPSWQKHTSGRTTSKGADHHVCPYSNATRGNVDVRLVIV